MRIQDVDALIPIILMSGNVSSDDAQAPGAQRFTAVLHKPVDPEELFRVLADVRGQSSPLMTGAEDLPGTATAV